MSQVGTPAGRRQQPHTRPFCMLIIVFMVLNIVLGGAAGQTFELLSSSVGIASMHTAITPISSNAILLDRTNVGPSRINLTHGACRDTPNDPILQHDCTAHSVMLTPGATASSTTLRPLMVLTNTWCSAGQFLPDGTLLQVGGDDEGLYKIRRLHPCPSSGTCDWVEDDSYRLGDPRWYSTTTLLPDGRVISVGGRNVTSYEFIPRAAGESIFFLQVLVGANKLYPFVHLLPDGTLYIFTGRDSVLLDYKTNKVIRSYPSIPGEPRNYPVAGSSVLLPLQYADKDLWSSSVEVLVCGGAQPANASLQLAASETCGRIKPLSADTSWFMETMPIRRCMGDMILLPTRQVLIVNGAKNGKQGWGSASNPALNPVVYSPDRGAEGRFVVHPPSDIPRMYHSTANLLPDGRVLIAGSNPHKYDTFKGAFPTELRVEAWTPPYMSPDLDTQRPYIFSAPSTFKFGETFTVTFLCKEAPTAVQMSLVSPPFSTHSFSHGQRLLRMSVGQPHSAGGNGAHQLYKVLVTAPPDANVAPPGFYMMFPVQSGIAGHAVWVLIMQQ